jgi:predicted dehydrogenase
MNAGPATGTAQAGAASAGGTLELTPFRLAVIGLGMGSRPHVAALKDLAGEGVEVAGVYARDAGKRARFAAQHGWPDAASPEALAEDPAVDGLLLLTPPDARRDLVTLFAGRGKPILMEKPVERTTAAATGLVRIAEAAGIPLGIVFQHRLKPAATALRAALDSGRLGRIAQVRVDVPWWRPQAYYDEPGRGTLARDGGGVLISQAIHALDLMLSLTAPVAEVTALTATTRLHRMETEDFACAALRFADGAVGAVTATTAAFPGGAETLAIYGTRGAALLAGGHLRLAFHDGTTEQAGADGGTGGGADPMAFDHGPHSAVIADFVDAVRAGRAPAVTGRSALAVHRLIDAILASSREGRRVAVAEDDE